MLQPHLPSGPALPRLDRRAVVERLTEDDVRRVWERLGVRHFASGGAGNWLVRSPFRPDANASVSVRRADGVWNDKGDPNARGSLFDAVMRARGCTFDEALRFVGETAGLSTLPPIERERPRLGAGDPAAGPAGRLVARYPYTDEQGRLLFEVLRYDPKRFSQRRPDGKGGWNWSLGDVRRVLYRLPELLAAPPDARIWLCEGEKDADALRDLGEVATTNPGGAGKWKPEYTASLAGRNVAIVPDHDQAGVQHMELLVGELKARTGRLGIVVWGKALRPGQDLSDFLAAGGSVAELNALVQFGGDRARLPQLVITPLSEIKAEPVEWLWDGWLPRGKLTLLGGHPGDGKSTLTAAIAAALSRGATLPDGQAAQTARTLFILAEDDAGDTLGPRLAVHGADLDAVVVLDGVQQPDGRSRPFNLVNHLPSLERAIRQHQIDLVVLDPLTAFLSSRDGNSDGQVREVLTPLAALAQRRRVALLGVMHIGKPATARRTALQALLGSTAFAAVARTVWMTMALDPPAGDSEGQPQAASQRRLLEVVKSNLAVRPPALEWSRPPDSRIEWHGPSKRTIEALLSPGRDERPNERRDQAVARAESFLREVLADGPLPSKEVIEAAEEAGIRSGALTRARRSLRTERRRVGRMDEASWYLALPGADWGRVDTGEEANEPEPISSSSFSSLSSSSSTSLTSSVRTRISDEREDAEGGEELEDLEHLEDSEHGEDAAQPSLSVLQLCWACGDALPVGTPEHSLGMCRHCSAGRFRE